MCSPDITLGATVQLLSVCSASIFLIIRSPIAMASAIAVSIAGHGLSNSASLRAARMHAAISRTRFHPSFISEGYHIRFMFAHDNLRRSQPDATDSRQLLLGGPARFQQVVFSGPSPRCHYSTIFAPDSVPSPRILPPPLSQWSRWHSRSGGECHRVHPYKCGGPQRIPLRQK